MKHATYLFSMLLIFFLPLISFSQTTEAAVDTASLDVRESLAVAKVFPTMDIDMEIYPNPVREVLYLRFEAPRFRLVWLTLYNCNGQVLQNRQIQIPTNLEMNVQDLSPGVYLLRVTDGKTVLTKRMMRQR